MEIQDGSLSLKSMDIGRLSECMDVLQVENVQLEYLRYECLFNLTGITKLSCLNSKKTSCGCSGSLP